MTTSGSSNCRQVTRITVHPAAKRRRSRSRSDSNAVRVRCALPPSSSTIKRWVGQRQSASSLRSPRSSKALSLGFGRSVWASREASLASSRLRTRPLGLSSSRPRQVLAVLAPRCPGCCSRIAPRSLGLNRWRYSASRIDASKASTELTAAMSRRVRARVVTGIRRLTQTSSAARRARCRQIASQDRVARGLVTSMRSLPPRRMPQSTAAERRLRTAPSPHSKTAASQRPSRGMTRWPTEYMPACNRWRRPVAIRRWIALSLTPIESSCARETTPYCRSARRASSWSSGRGCVFRRYAAPAAASPVMPGTLAVPGARVVR